MWATRVVDVHIGQIRKIEIDTTQPILIQTVRALAIVWLESKPAVIVSFKNHLAGDTD